MVTILLVRHGENDWVNKKRLAGWIPGVNLNDNGMTQAEQVAKRLAPLPIKAVYSSPLTRCIQTAAPIARAHQLQVISVEALGEVRYGRWEGKKIKELVKKRSWHRVQHFPSRFRFPNGESLPEVQSRAVVALEELSARHEKEMVVVVSHADVLKLVLAYYLGMHIDLFQRIAISPASVSVLALPADGSVRVLRVNDEGPLQAPPPAAAEKGEKEKKKVKKKRTEAEPGPASAQEVGEKEEL